MRGIEEPAWNYIIENFAAEDEALKSINEALREDSKDGIQVSPVEGKILHFLARLISAKKIVEVGTLYGYSALWLSRALPEGGQLWCLEKSEENFAKAQQLLRPQIDKGGIEILLGEASENLKKISHHGPFDMVFIDANKSGYPDYLDWAEENLRPGGLIIGDNTFLWGDVYAEKEQRRNGENMVEAMRSFNHRLSQSKSYNSILLPTKEGLTVAQKIF